MEYIVGEGIEEFQSILEKDYLNGHHIWKIQDWIPKNIFIPMIGLHGLLTQEKSAYYIKKKGYISLNEYEWWLFSKNTSETHIVKKYIDKVELYEPENEIKKLEKERYLKKIWSGLSENKNAIYLLEKNLEKIDWKNLSINPNALKLLEDNIDKIDWDALSLNPNPKCLDLFKKYDKMDAINWLNLSSNEGAIHILEENPNKIDWSGLSQNRSAIHLLEMNPGKINWKTLQFNASAMHLIEQHLEKIDMLGISSNPSAIHLLKQYHIENDNLPSEKKRKMLWGLIILNSGIFEIDYDFLFQRMNIIRKELIAKTWHPSRFQKWCLSIDELKDLN